MKFTERKLPLMLILGGALIVLLALLAVLQYRWLGQVSAGERELMQASLRISADRFREDFNREFNRAYSTFEMNEAALRDEAGSGYAERYADWFATAAYPQIVKGVYRVKKGEDGEFYLARFDEATRSFAAHEWPAEFADLRRRFEQQQQSGDKARPDFSGTPDSIAENIPALVSSIASTKTFGERKEIDWWHPAGYVIIALDPDYIRQEFIPALAGHYFSDGGKLDYNLTVISRSDPQRIIYQSDASSNGTGSNGATLSSGDATINLLSLNINTIKSYSSASINQGRGRAGGGESSQRAGYTLVIPELKDGDASKNGGGVLLIDDSARWQLIIKHRAGSLAAAVAALRRRNLIISFSVLLLLASSVALIIVSSQRMRRAARRQMEFVAGVTHELRTPLAVICSAGENLADGVINDRRQIERYGTVIRNEGRRLSEMVEHALEFAGIESGQKAYHLRPVNVEGLIEDALEACQPQLEESGFEIEKHLQPGLPQVLADSAALTRAIQNLLTNAMKYGGQSCWIGLSAQTSDAPHETEVRITIEDKGQGISPGDLPHIFEPFRRGREAITAQIYGSGLGLSLVKRIVEAHNGKISVESVHGRGSSFTLHLPVTMIVRNVDDDNNDGSIGNNGSTGNEYEKANSAC